MAELYCLAAWHRVNGAVPDAGKWLVVIANWLSSATPGPSLVSPASGVVYRTWPGLDPESLARAAEKCLLEVSQKQLDERLASTLEFRRGKKHRPPMSAEKVAEMLGVTAIMRRECKLRHIGAIDETPQDRAKQRREMKRLYLETRRRDKGAKPRKEWIMKHNKSATKPWKAEGISRRTWERRRRDFRAIFCANSAVNTSEQDNSAEQADAGPKPFQVLSSSQAGFALASTEPKQLPKPQWQTPVIEEIWNGGGKVFRLPHDANGRILPLATNYAEVAFYSLRNLEVAA